MNQDNITTGSTDAPQNPVPSPLPSQKTRRTGVPVGLGTFLGALLLFGGIASLSGLSGQTSPADRKQTVLIATLLAVVGATLAGGGAFVLLAERKGEGLLVSTEGVGQGPKRTPKWAYVFAGVTFIGCFLGTLLGLHFAGYSGRFFPGAVVGTIAGACGAVPAFSCILTSRSEALSVPRRIYECILITGFSCPVALNFAYKLFSSK